MCGGGGGGHSDIFIHVRRLGPFKILKFDIFSFFQKINIFLGYDNFVDIFLGS